MGRAGRDWTQIYAIYGMDDWHTSVFLLIYAILFSASSISFLLYFNWICYSFESIFHPLLSNSVARFAGAVMALSAACLFYAARNMFYSSVPLRWDWHNVWSTKSTTCPPSNPSSTPAAMEGVQEYVTCREGDARRLLFPENYFDVVVSAGFVHVGRDFGERIVGDDC